MTGMTNVTKLASEPSGQEFLVFTLGDEEYGIDILKAVKRDNPGVPVVIISGHGNIDTAVSAIGRGALDFIEKPFARETLAEQLAKWCPPRAAG